ncbi:hypothetical protein Pmani_010108 [Petrolisthes manimaculis]|uniref:RNA-directed DNA polymerase n=1 Tax=Petrolisthes manimaculis TaxID=1843537 RepID=A0AAE1UD01_9EUCA|nr:hypothetical protein Pmani_010108 [Petrolisthes manimaculis]
MGRKKNSSNEVEPYLIQHHPLTAQQLVNIFGAAAEMSKSVVSQVQCPKVGQVFLVDCAGARFARYDSHRWITHYYHYGLNCLDPTSSTEPMDDVLEVRYNKKLGNHTNLCNDAMRIVYKLRTKNAQNIKGFHIVHYLEKLPDDVEEMIKQKQGEQETMLKEMEEKLKNEREAEAAEKDTRESIITSSSFGRKRKPNSRYSSLYTDLESPLKLSRQQGDPAGTTDQEEDYGDDEIVESLFMEEEVVGVGQKAGKQQGKRPLIRHGGAVWMAGYGQEKTKPKSTLLFRMYDDKDEDDDSGEEEEGSKPEQTSMLSEGDSSFCETGMIDTDHHYKVKDIEENHLQLLYYSVDIPSPVLVSRNMPSVKAITNIIDKVLKGKMYVCTSAVLLPKLGELFVLRDDHGVEGEEAWVEEGKFSQDIDLNIIRYRKATSPHSSSTVEPSVPDIKLVYQTERHQQFCLVHFLSSEQHWVTQPVINLLSHTDKQVASDKCSQSPVEEEGTKGDGGDDPIGQNMNKECDVRKCERGSDDHDKEDTNSWKNEENVEESEVKDESGGEEGRSAGERRGKHPGRPKYRGLDTHGFSKAEDEEGRRKDFEEDEPRPFKIYSRGKLYHADAEELFKRAKSEGLTVYKTEVRKPQNGDIYLLDKNFVPYSDSLAWVREYYHKSPPILMERYTLRDPTTPFNHPLPPKTKTVFTSYEDEEGSNTQLCIVHYLGFGKSAGEGSRVKRKSVEDSRVYTESNSNLNLSLVETMLTNPDQKRVVSAPILNPQPFQVYLIQLPTDKDSKVIDNYRWTDKGFKRWPPSVPADQTRLLCHHSPMKVTRGAMCAALIRHEFRLTSGSPHLRVVHYTPTREFREYIVIANAANQMKKTTEASQKEWENMELETEVPIHVSCSRLKPEIAWELLSRESSTQSRQLSASSLSGQSSVATTLEIAMPQPGGVYLSTKYESPDLLKWEELGKLQIQPRMYQLVEVCEKVRDDGTLPPYLVRLSYTSPKVPHRVLIHYLGDTRPYAVRECQVVINGYTGETCYRVRGRKEKCGAPLSFEFSLKEAELYRISTSQLREAGCCPVKLEDLYLDIDTDSKFLQQQQVENELLPPDKPGLYIYGYRMVNKRVIRVLENADRSRKTHLPIKNPEAGEVYLITKPSSSKVAIDPYKWTQKGWQPIPRKAPVILWRWGLMRHRKLTWAPPLIRIDYVHVSCNTDLMLVHYLPTKDNQNMLEINSAIVPMRTQTHTLLSMGDVNFGQHSQLLTNSPLPPSHIWELLNAGGGLTQLLSQPQPGGVYVINMDEKEALDWINWRVLGSLRLSSADYCLMETASVVEWDPPGLLARLTYHSPLIKNRTVIHYLGDSRPYLEKAKEEEIKYHQKLETMRRKFTSSGGLEIECLEMDDTQLSLPDIPASRDPATELVGSILAGLGSNTMDTDTLNNTFAELGGEVEGLCEGQLGQESWRAEDDHLRDANLPAIQVPFGSVSTTGTVKQLFPEGLPKIVLQKVLEVEVNECNGKKRRLDNLLDLADMKIKSTEEEKVLRDPHRAVPRTMLDWNDDIDEREEGVEESSNGGDQQRARLQITTTEPRTIVYLKQQDTLTEKQIDHMLCNPDVTRISFLPLLDPQPGEVYVVAIPYRKGETRRIDCYNWYVTGHKKGKYRRTYSYIREEDGNTSHRLMRYTYDYAWETHPGLRVVHYISGDPKHQVQCSGKKPNFEEERENQGDGPMYRAYTAPMTHRDVLLILNDPPQYHLCELPIKNPRAGDVYIVKAPSVALAKRETLYDTLTWAEGQVKHLGGKRPVVRKMKYLSMDPEDGTKSDAFVRMTWERLVDITAAGSELPPASCRRQPCIIIHYLGDETLAGEMVRKGKDGALHLRQIRHYLETGSYLPSVHITEKNGIRKSAKKFKIEGKAMYYIGKMGDEKRLVLYTNEEKNKVFEECHILGKTGEHCGRTKTLRRLTEKYYWTSMVEDIVAQIVRCKTCDFSKMHRSNQRYVRVTEPWEIVSIDIIGQFVSSDRGHVFLAVIIDMLTKYTIAVPLRDTTAPDITQAIQTAVYQQGPPRKFVSDQHEEFVKELNIALELDTGLVGNVVAVNKTQINRPDEAAIKTSILQHCIESGSAWDDVLQKKIYEINTNYVTASGYTPFYLLFHRQARPLDVTFHLQLSSGSKPNFVVRDIERYIEERDQKATDILNQALMGETTQETSEAGDADSGECVEAMNVTTTSLFDAVSDGGETSVQVVSNMDVSTDGQTGVQVVSDMNTTGVDEDHSHYTHVAHLPDNHVVDEGGGSVYEMGDGEGQVVVVANGLTGLDEGGGEVVVVQPTGVGGEQGVIMLAENQVIMETVDGHQFTYMPQT